MYPKQPKMVITQIINVPKGTRGRLYRALGENRIHKWSHRKLQGEHDASITWILRRYDPPSPSFFFFFENRSFSPLHKAPFAPHSRGKFLFFEIDRFPPCMKAPLPPRTRVAEENFDSWKSVVSPLA